VLLNEAVRSMLAGTLNSLNSSNSYSRDVSFVFTARLRPGPLAKSTLQHQHTRVCQRLGLPEEFVIRLRHTFLTRLGESGADSFSIKRIAGHSSVVISEKYVHPTPESLQRVFERLHCGIAAASTLHPALLHRKLNEDDVLHLGTHYGP
jgi:site-specific recombinase XerD